MPDSKRFNPLDWLLGASMTVLVSAGALVLAFHLMESIWPWLVGGAVLNLILAMALRAGWIWWTRRQPW